MNGCGLQQARRGPEAAGKRCFAPPPRSFSNRATRRPASTRSSNAPVGRSATSTMSSETSRACSPPSSRKTPTRCFRRWSLSRLEGHDLRATLTAFGQHLMGVYMSPTLIGIYRIAVTEANRFPDLVKSFYEQGPGRATSRLAEVLEAANRARGNPDGRLLASGRALCRHDPRQSSSAGRSRTPRGAVEKRNAGGGRFGRRDLPERCSGWPAQIDSLLSSSASSGFLSVRRSTRAAIQE